MLEEIDSLQTEIMLFMKEWASIQNKPIPRKQIVARMVAQGKNQYTTMHAISSLIIKGYIRRAYTEKQNQTSYVMIRNI